MKKNEELFTELRAMILEENGDGGDGEGAGNEDHYDQVEDYYDEGQGSQLQDPA